MDDPDSVFPFGTAAGRCAPREVTDAEAFVLGVYPSALHIRWQGPEPDQRVAALAVAPEPYPFWPGDDQEARVVRWREEVGWQTEWGTASPVHLNGSSGRAVVEEVLTPLQIDPARVWFSDALPFFFVKAGERTQGEAMSQRYDPFARSIGLSPHRLPRRPTPAALVRRAVDEEGDRLRRELESSRAPLLITLGNEALAVAAGLLGGDLPERIPSHDAYGRRLPASVHGRALEVLPLKHPGQRGEPWESLHRNWIRDADEVR